MGVFKLIAVVAVALTAILFSYPSNRPPLKQQPLMPVDAVPPAAWKQPSGEYALGRWRKAMREPAFDMADFTPAERVFVLKEWQFMSVSSEDFLLAFALVQFRYVSDVFLYVEDLKNKDTPRVDYVGRRPGGIGVSFAPSSIVGCGNWSEGFFSSDSPQISVCYDTAASPPGWKIDISLTATQGADAIPVSADFFIEDTGDALAYSVAIPPQHLPTYVHKAAGMRVSHGQLRVGDSQRPAVNALASLDWTRSFAKRETNWKWFSFSGYASVQHFDERGSKQGKEKKSAVGINLSADVYDVNGTSAENAVWVDGAVSVIPAVRFDVPSNLHADQWAMKSYNSPDSAFKFDVTFTPRGSREDHSNFVVIVSEFVQAYGLSHGAIVLDASDGGYDTITFTDGPSLAEVHHAVW